MGGRSGKYLWRRCRKDALLDNVRGSPGQIYTSSIYYLEGYIESAFAVSAKDAAATIDIASKVSQDVRLPSIYQCASARPPPVHSPSPNSRRLRRSLRSE